MIAGNPVFRVFDITLLDGLVADTHFERNTGLVRFEDFLPARRPQVFALYLKATSSEGFGSFHVFRQGVAAHFLNASDGRDRRRNAVIPTVRAVLPQVANPLPVLSD